MKTTIALFGILTTTVALAIQVQAQSSLTNGLVAYWPFNGNAEDESGNGNNGVVYGTTLIADRFGNANSASSFDGVAAYVRIGAAPKPLEAPVIKTHLFLSGEAMRIIQGAP